MHLNFDVDLAPFNTFGVSARCQAFAEVEHWSDIEPLLGHPRLRQSSLLVLGGGSNVLFRQDYQGAVLKISSRGMAILEETDDHVYVRIAAGEAWHDVVVWSVLRGLWGLENLALIPGQVGAAPIQNIGAYGAELADSFVSLKAYDREQERWTDLDREACRFGYRSSLFKSFDPDRYIITEVILQLRQGRHGKAKLDYPGLVDEISVLGGSIDPVTIAEAVTRIRQRKLPNPADYGNAGSFFKNPIVSSLQFAAMQSQNPTMNGFEQADGSFKLSAAWLIDQCGLKGQRIGGAGVYREHALVLVNHGGASGEQLWKLALTVQDAVLQRFGVLLEPEPLIV